MQRVPKQIIQEMLNILFVDNDKNITDESSRLALEFAKAQESKFRKTLYAGLFLELRAYKKRKKLDAKQKKLLGE